ncbi:DUF4233 domain-containing protein [Kineococcus glutinatus]|uniref:DUF4233 domain-containing protein n=1 Tax=Kineococcus glutinatus TaxID=1070872 RepID=A0ABP9HAR9_9ACTN
MKNPRRAMAATVLVSEALVVLFAALVAMRLSGAGTAASLGAFGALSLLCLLCAGLLRVRAGYVLGSVLQVAVVAGGLLVPLMFGVGALFAVLWFTALHLGARIEREQAEVARRLRP